MSDKIQARNLPAQLRHRATGNPEHTLPHTAISNCFPGLETDFRNFWRRAFVGLVLLECDNYVTEMEDPALPDLKEHRLLQVGEQPIVTTVIGPPGPHFDARQLQGGSISSGVASMEWSNALAAALQYQEQTVPCYFTKHQAHAPEPLPLDPKTGAFDPSKTLAIHLTVRKLFIGESAAISLDLIKPGELSQGLCSPWQNDYRECACYYWAASRPDYVNVEPTPEGVSRGDNWMSKKRNGEYILDDRKDQRMWSYDDLFQAWEASLRFQIRGRDATETEPLPKKPEA
ncbi:MAG TPA: hypothetical protein VGO11_16725 [Chthoniobacteraceae bacterium]|jgi:hypothetical protein|nr:hypothetical protein [Chthoniobacteraceae bacterium]